MNFELLLGYKNDPYLDYDPTLKPDDMITQGRHFIIKSVSEFMKNCKTYETYGS